MARFKIDFSEIALVTTVANFKLYDKTKAYHPTGIRRISVDGRSGMYGLDSLYYIFEKLPLNDVRWLILADEDVLFLDAVAIFDIINKMQSEGYCVAGIRDGGSLPNRRHNPYLPNTFFCILDYKRIASDYNRSEIKRNQTFSHNEFNDDLSNLKGDYEKGSLYEPYYCFFLWLKRKGERFLFLEGNLLHPYKDDLATKVFSIDQKPMLIHTWYARAYSNNPDQTKRIDDILKEYAPSNEYNEESIEMYSDRWFKYELKLRKFLNRVETKFRIHFG